MSFPKIIILPICILLLSGCNGQKSTNLDLSQPSTPSASSPSSLVTTKSQTPSDKIVALNTSYGQILIKLYTKEAPNTTANFLKKIDSGFYRQLTFHRVDPGFVVQGGDLLGNGTGGSTIKSEINNIPFRRASVGLARGQVKELSNDSQFFVCLSDDGCRHLTNDYVNFGEIVSGMEFVDQIKPGDKIIDIIDKTK